MIVIYHSNCLDGFAAAYIASLRYPEATFFAAQYGDPPPCVDGQDVLIVDFSYSRDVLLDMWTRTRTLRVLDHHKTAEASLAGLDCCTFDLARSGAMLIWDHLFAGVPAPLLVSYVQDRDLWLWKLPHSREVSAYLWTIPRIFESWALARGRIETDMDAVVKLGAFALRVSDEYVESHVPRAGRVEIDGHVVPCINTTFAVSELVGELAQGHPFAAGWFQRDDGRFVYSLRSREPSDVDVSAIARKYGGGGHARAAGFTLACLLPLVSE